MKEQTLTLKQIPFRRHFMLKSWGESVNLLKPSTYFRKLYKGKDGDFYDVETNDRIYDFGTGNILNASIVVLSFVNKKKEKPKPEYDLKTWTEIPAGLVYIPAEKKFFFKISDEQWFHLDTPWKIQDTNPKMWRTNSRIYVSAQNSSLKVKNAKIG